MAPYYGRMRFTVRYCQAFLKDQTDLHIVSTNQLKLVSNQSANFYEIDQFSECTEQQFLSARVF